MGISFKRQLEQDDSYFKLYKFTCQLPMKQSYMLSYLIDADDFVNYRLSDDIGFFMCCKANFINKMLTGWSDYQITSAINELENAGYIYKRVENIDGRNITYIKLNVEAINNLNAKYKNLNDQQQEIECCNNKNLYLINNNKINNNNQKQFQNIYSVDSLRELEELEKQESISVFNRNENNYTNVQESVQHDGEEENVCSIVKEVIEYLNSKTGSNYRPKTYSTKKIIKARIKEGYTLEDFKHVIDVKCMEWLNDEKMSKYLRPQTLFGNKFENYVNQKVYINTHKEIQNKVRSSTPEEYAAAEEYRKNHYAEY